MFLNLALLPSSGPRFLPSPGSATSLGWPHLWLVRRWVAAAGPSLPSAPEGRLPELPRGWGGLPQMPPGLLRSVALPRVPGPLPDQPLPRAGLGSRPTRWPQPYPGEGAQPQKGKGGGKARALCQHDLRGPLRPLQLPGGDPALCAHLSPMAASASVRSVLFWTFLSVFTSEICPCYKNLLNSGR